MESIDHGMPYHQKFFLYHAAKTGPCYTRYSLDQNRGARIMEMTKRPKPIGQNRIRQRWRPSRMMVEPARGIQ